ncbi:MAG: hypothetical protein ACSHX6_07785 [Akkermansiaceae bacterium]
MKTLLIATALCSSALISPIMAQSTSASSKRATNDVALEALNHVKTIFATAATASDPEKATAAAATINATTSKIVALQTVLKASPMPTVPEKKAFAQKMLQYEAQVSTVMKKMTNTFNTNSEDVSKIIQPAISSFKAKSAATMTLINTYYPRKEMSVYMNELKGK